MFLGLTKETIHKYKKKKKVRNNWEEAYMMSNAYSSFSHPIYSGVLHAIIGSQV